MVTEIQKHHPRKLFNHTTSFKIPSRNCKQHLSVDELEQRTQNNRIARHTKMLSHKEIENNASL